MCKLISMFKPHRSDDGTARELSELRRAVVNLTQRINQMTQAMDNLTAAVAAEKTVEDSVVTLLTTLASELQAALAASGTPDPAIQAVADQITANTTALAAAVSTNTPPPPPTP